MIGDEPRDSSQTSSGDWCARLRTKGMYLPPNDLADGRSPGGSSTAVFWCLKTMKMTGPDDGPVAPEVCVTGRSCFRTSD